MPDAMNIGSEERARIIALAAQNYAADIADAAERVKIQASIADRALQSLMLANGGAMVALFSFVGSAHAIRFAAAGLKSSFFCFAAGLVATLAAHVAAFLSQHNYYFVSMHEAQRYQRIVVSGEQRTERAMAELAQARGDKAYLVGVICSVLSTTGFAMGCWFALQAVM